MYTKILFFTIITNPKKMGKNGKKNGKINKN
jgi:hypothetical protein